MATKEKGETKSRQWLQALSSFFVNAFTRTKLLLGLSKGTMPAARTGNTANIETSGTKEAGNTANNSADLLTLPPYFRHKFFNIARSQREINPSLLNHGGNHSILALLNINNMYFWGHNKVHFALTPRELNDLKAILDYHNSLSAYSPLLVQPETSAILEAFKQKMTADRATMFIERKNCDVCGRREFDTRDLRKLLPILSLRELTVYTTNSRGKISRLLLSPLSSSTSHTNLG